MTLRGGIIKRSPIYKVISILIIVSFSLSTITPVSFAQQSIPVQSLLIPNASVGSATIIKGLKLYPENPLKFDFIIDQGGIEGKRQKVKGKGEEEALRFKTESKKLIKYFLASLTTKESDLWVNLNPKQPDRIIPDKFGSTEMGRDLLAQDYILKQITASLMHPEGEMGKKFWGKIYKQAYEQYGISDVDTDVLNRVWIVPEKAVVYEAEDRAFVVESRLKVLLEEEYLDPRPLILDTRQKTKQNIPASSILESSIIKSVIIPALEQEVNEGESFAPLRQIYNSLILATWYKRNLKESLLGRKYVDKDKVIGLEIQDKSSQSTVDSRQKITNNFLPTANRQLQTPEEIYNQYLKTFKDGAYNYIKEEYNPATKQIIPKKYFCGGKDFAMISKVLKTFDKNINPKRSKLFGKYLAVTAALVLTSVVFSVNGQDVSSVEIFGQEKRLANTTVIVSKKDKAYWIKLAKEDPWKILDKIGELKDFSWGIEIMEIVTEEIPYTVIYNLPKIIEVFRIEKTFNLIEIAAENAPSLVIRKAHNFVKILGQEKAFDLIEIAAENAPDVAFYSLRRLIKIFGKEKALGLATIALENDPKYAHKKHNKLSRLFNLSDDFFKEFIENNLDLFLSPGVNISKIKLQYRIFLEDTPFKEPIDIRTEHINMSGEQKISLTVAAIRLCRMLDISFQNLDYFSAAVDCILELREESDKNIIFGKEISIINVANIESRFDISAMESFETSAGALLENIQSFKEGVDSKMDMLDAIKASKGLLTIFYSGHGEKAYLDSWYGITYQRLGDALIARGDIESVNILNFSCFSYNFIKNLKNYLIEKGHSIPKFMSSEANKNDFGVGGTLSGFLAEIQAQRNKNGRASEPVRSSDFINGETPNVFVYQDPAFFYGIRSEEFKKFVEKHFGQLLLHEKLIEIFNEIDSLPSIMIEIGDAAKPLENNPDVPLLALAETFEYKLSDLSDVGVKDQAMVADENNISQLVSYDFSKEEWFKRAHRSELYHNVKHSVRTGLSVYNLAIARNMGAIEAEGDILVFCDSRLQPDKDSLLMFQQAIEHAGEIT
ncbi:MAG: hypothetical protein P9X22_01285, partial [Candidatus Zapsychrus exili]|nr:hypothetical protein [Candidatus Zapsychrus exili]